MAEKRRKLWDNYVKLHEVRKDHRNKLVIYAGARDGYRCLVIREFYYRKRDDTWCPGRDGIIVPLKAPIALPDKPSAFLMPLKKLVELLPECIEFISTMPLHDPANEVWYEPKEKAE